MEREITRFVRFEHDGDRTLSGTVVRYGDIADALWEPWARETMKPKAFGDLADADVMLDVQHDRRKPLGRTGGGGVTLTDTAEKLILTAVLPKTTVADDVLELVRTNVLRGFSVRMNLLKDPRPRKSDGVAVIEPNTAELIAVGVVDKPAYPKSTINRNATMNKDEILALIRAEKEAGDEGKAAEIDEDKLADRIATKLATAQAAAEEATRTAAAAAEEATRKAAEIEANAERRATTLVTFRSLLPDNYVSEGQDEKAILVAAAGEEIKDAKDQEVGYLRAKLEGILERRAESSETGTGTTGKNDKPGTGTAGGTRAPGIDIWGLRSRKQGA